MNLLDRSNVPISSLVQVLIYLKTLRWHFVVLMVYFRQDSVTGQSSKIKKKILKDNVRFPFNFGLNRKLNFLKFLKNSIKYLNLIFDKKIVP